MNKSIYDQTVEQIFAQLNQCISEGRKKLLEPKSFEMYYGGFIQIISQSISFFSTPAIIIKDNQGSKYAIVAGEKWKLLTYMIYYGSTSTKEVTIKFTNPLTMNVSETVTTPAACADAMVAYEPVYDFAITKVMDLNSLMLALQTAPTNGDKLKAMGDIIDVLRAIANNTKDYYQDCNMVC